MFTAFSGPLTVVVLALSAYSLAKFAFFLLPYATRRRAVDRQYAGRAAPSAAADGILLALAAAVGFGLLASERDPIALLGGLFVGATLIQLFFHAFREPVADDREAPAPVSPLKRMSYAIQDRPARALREMLVMTALIAAGVIAYFVGS